MDKRTHSRTKVSKKSSYEVSSSGRTEAHLAEILDISRGGACIRTERSLESGNVIRLKLDLMDNDIQIPCIAEVRWARSDNSKYMVGLEFLA